MSNISQIANTIQLIFGKNANNIARDTGFIKRERKFSGSSFAKSLVFGWTANPESSLSELQQAAAVSGVDVTPQAIDKKFTVEASEFMHNLLQEAVQHLLYSDSKVDIPIFDRFNGVYIDDSSVITLPDSLKYIWRGCGGIHCESAALKIHFSYDYKAGSIRKLCLTHGREQDKSSPSQKANLPQKALRIHDKGFNSLKVKKDFENNNIFWLCPYKADINVYDKTDQQIDLVKFLKSNCQDSVDIAISLGAKAKVNCRLIVKRVPKEIADERRRKIIYNGIRKGQPASQRVLELANWIILITNCPEDLLSVEEAIIVYRVRWQIELMFKLWKSYSYIDEWRTEKQWRILCEIYAKLLAVLIQHWVFLSEFWCLADKSLMKASQTVKKFAFSILQVINNLNQLTQVLSVIQKCLMSGCRIQKRTKRPTFQLALNLFNS